MLELPLVFLAGLLGSAHCLGMCGPLAMALGGGARTWKGNLGRQLGYTLGRLFTYATLGAAAGFGGWRLARHAPGLSRAGAVLAIAAGLFLIYQGLLSAGVLRHRPLAPGPTCLGGDFVRAMLRRPGLAGVFLAGLFTGLIPCGLVYGFIGLAAASTDMGAGAALMAAFGLGTAPAMITAGCSGSLLSALARGRVFRLAAWCVVLTGLLSVARGAGYLPPPDSAEPAGCPLCVEPLR